MREAELLFAFARRFLPRSKAGRSFCASNCQTSVAGWG